MIYVVHFTSFVLLLHKKNGDWRLNSLILGCGLCRVTTFRGGENGKGLEVRSQPCSEET